MRKAFAVHGQVSAHCGNIADSPQGHTGARRCLGSAGGWPCTRWRGLQRSTLLARHHGATHAPVAHDAVQISECTIQVDPVTKLSRGFGFVAFKYESEGLKAMEAMHRTELGGGIIKVEVAKRKRAWTPTPGRYLGTSVQVQQRRQQEFGRDRPDRFDRGPDRRDAPRRHSSPPPRNQVCFAAAPFACLRGGARPRLLTQHVPLL